MSTHTISFLPAPGPSISTYNRANPSSAQPSTIPPTFLDAMSIREQVFVHEQKCSLENELDADDPRSFHWVLYASSPEKTSANTIPIGTLRIIPPPHPLHPEPGTSHAIDKAEDAEKVAQHNPHNEAYVKLGRLAVLREFRGLGHSKALVENALEWTAGNEQEIVSEAEGKAGEWKGLVLIHAQIHLEGMYVAWGFVRDREMGIWDEEGIDHIGMWRRLVLKPRRGV